MALITLSEWNQRQPRPRCIEQVRRWVRAGRIQPSPKLDGREYLVDENAVKIDLCNPSSKKTSSLKERILYGRTEKKPQN